MIATTVSFELIQSAGELASLLPVLRSMPSLALDMEMENHYHRYGLHIALIQISTPNDRHYIIDPLSEPDLKPLGELFEDPSRQLILHDMEFDNRASAEIYGWKLRGVFDTKIAAEFCGCAKIGLSNLLGDYFGLKVNKRFQTLDWMKRPLAADALDYAIGDTAYLHALRDKLAERLKQLGRTEWVEEEFRLAEEKKPLVVTTPCHHRIKRSSLLTPQQLAVLGGLCAFRDQTAKKINRPLHFIARNEVLLSLAKRSSFSLAELKKMRGIHPVLRNTRTAKRLLDVWQTGQKAKPEIHSSKKRRPHSAYDSKKRLKEMQEWRTELARNFALPPHLLLDNDVLIWCANHKAEVPPPEITKLIRNWQKEISWQRFAEKFAVPTS